MSASPTPTSPDRTVAPAPGPAPEFAPPPLQVLDIAGVRAAVVEAPVLGFSVLQLGVGAGHRFTPPEQAGRASLIADVLCEGTRALDGTALVDELDGLGAALDVRVGDDELILEMHVLSRHLERGADILLDLLFEPRFAQDDFARAQRQRLARLQSRKADGAALAADAWRSTMFGAGHALGMPPAGTEASVAGLQVDDLAATWRDALAADNVRLAVAGPSGADRIAGAFARLGSLRASGASKPVVAGDPGASATPSGRRATIVHRADAPQTQVRVGHLAAPASDPAFFSLVAMNHPLGGAVSSRLSQNLRETRGWTYGVRSGFQGGAAHGWFQVATAVDSRHGAASVREILAEIDRLLDGGYEADEVEFTRGAIGRTLLLQYASADAKAAFAANVGKYGWPTDYPARRLAWIRSVEAGELLELARRHIRPEELAVVCVGPEDQLRAGLRELGF